MQRATHPSYSFDDFTVDLAAGCLLRAGQEVKLRPKSFEALRYLVENSGRLVSKDELMQALWPDSFVTENSLVKCMRDVRLALEDESQHYIKTVPKRGYIFTAEVGENNPATTGENYRDQFEGIRIVIEEEQERATDEAHLKKDPENFLASAADSIWWRLRRNRMVPALGLGLTGLVLAFSYYLTTGRSRQPVIAAPKSIAVLPFKPLVAESRDESFEMGMTDTLITKLSSLKQVTVRPISAVRRYGRLDQDPVEAGREQGVDAVLDGSIQMSGGKVRVTVRFVNVRDGTQLWAYKTEEPWADIFSMQDSISEKVAGTLALNLTGDEQKLLTKRYTGSLEAYQLYLKGRYFWELRTEESMMKAVDYFEQAIQIDQNYAVAYAGIGHAYTALRARGYVPAADGARKMKEAATRALQIDDNLAEAHTVLGTYKITEFDWPGAEREFKRAIELDPNYPTAHLWYGFLLEGLGRQDENIAEKKRAQELDPVNFEINAGMGDAYLHAGLYDKAIEQETKALELNPSSQNAHQYMGQAYFAKGFYDKAISEFEQGWSKGYLGHAYGVSGRRAEARKTLAALLEASKQRYVSPLDIAQIYIGLDDRDRALAWLQKAYEEHVTYLLFLKVDPVYSRLLSDPRFQDLLRRTNLQSPGPS
jgi:DNA-binding winged helix-turn-helix (wHTH) protein/TolB-like protein/Tfp pilus assembly protein PilF